MRFCRKVSLMLLCCCLMVGGRGFAMPIDAAMSSMDASTAGMHDACPGMDDAMSMDEGGEPTKRGKPGCCTTDACRCVAVHGFAPATFPTVAHQPRVADADATPRPTTGYVSPVLARLSRPPIA